MQEVFEHEFSARDCSELLVARKAFLIISSIFFIYISDHSFVKLEGHPVLAFGSRLRPVMRLLSPNSQEVVSR